PNELWQMDVTYVHIAGYQWWYEEARRVCGELMKNPFILTDNGPSFISRRFHDHVLGQYSHQRIRYRTPAQLGLLERFHQTPKEEEVYWRLYDSPSHARECFPEFREMYNRV
ncbi:MAG: integrase core domain-containing protein, partial [Candidatus Glassbacteria bacterium]